ncbi:MAG: hypothetical protein K6D02_02070 [Lachnospiraceae bacterium]|nr:hypothetical protein [Lachnospiraceae bacterium]
MTKRKKRNLKKCFLKKTFSVFLAGAIIVSSPLGVKVVSAKEEASKKYIKEVVLSYGKTEEDAVNWLKKNGYNIVNGNINSGTDDDGNIETNVVLMGYKTTSDRKDAIKDMAVMNMTGGYNEANLEEFLNNRNKEIDEDMDSFMEMVRAYKANYKKAVKSKAVGGTVNANALRVHDILNKYIEEDSGKGMGDYLLKDFSNKNNEEKLRAIFIQANTSIRGSIQNTLAMATGDGNENWIKRMAILNKKDGYLERMTKAKRTEKRAKDYIDFVFGKQIDKAMEEIENIKERVVEAAEISKEIKEQNKDTDKITDEDVREFFGVDSKVEEVNENAKTEKEIEKNLDMADEICDSSEATIKAQQYVETTSVMAYLGGFSYEKDNLLEFLCKGEEYFKKDDNRYELGAIFEAMSEAELEAYSKSMNLFTAIRNGMQDDDSLWKGDKTVTNNIKALDSNIKGIEKVSIYEGVNRKMYESTVAVTQAGQSRSQDVFGSGYSPTVNGIIVATGFITTAIGGLFAFAGAKFMAGLMSINFAEEAVADYAISEMIIKAQPFISKINMAFKNVCTYVIHFTGYSQYYYDLKDSYYKFDTIAMARKSERAVVRFHYITTGLLLAIGIAIAAFGIYMSVKGIWNIINDRKASYNGDYDKEIPEFMIDVSYDDNELTDYNYYEAVRCNRTDPDFTGVKKDKEGLKDIGDINGDTGKQWVALYVTKDEGAGEPILADSLTVNTGNTAFNDEFKQLHSFNEPNSGFNLTSSVYNYSDKNDGTYLLYKKDSTDLSKAEADDNAKDTASVLNNKSNISANPVLFAIIGIVGVFAGYFIGIITRKKEKE